MPDKQHQHEVARLKNRKKSNAINTGSKKPNVAIMTHATFERSGLVPLNKLITLIGPLTNKLFLFTGGDYADPPRGAELIRIKAERRTSFVGRALQQAVTHVRILRLLAKMRREIDILIFYFGTPFPVPLLFAQALHIKCFIILASQGGAQWAQAVKVSGTPRRFGELTIFYISEACERISYFFSDKLIVYSPSSIDQMKLHRYAAKTAIARQFVPNLSAFDIVRRFEDRQDIIGYVGRLNEEKGILNLLEAIPQVVSERPDLRFAIIGEGRLRDQIQEWLGRNNLAEHVELVPWVSHDELPAWFNKFKLLVIPSYTEGLPNVMLEAMACGTPVLAAPVGGVPDVIEDGKTGFLLENNTPRCIAASIIKAISWSNLGQVSKNVYAYVREEFTSTKASEEWSEILN